VAGAASYALQVSTGVSFATTVLSQTDITGSSALISGLANNTTYYWELNASNTDSTSVWTSAWQFTTNIASWNMSNDYSGTYNPNNAWSYGRKWRADSNSFTLMTVNWGTKGWYFGNSGGNPSMQAGGNPVELWAYDNSNGLPTVRWTSPTSTYYQFTASFTGGDSRGVSVECYVALNNQVVDSASISLNGASANFSSDTLFINQGSYIDFLIKWNGQVPASYSWTDAKAIINEYLK
jgi:hypothetical protein